MINILKCPYCNSSNVMIHHDSIYDKCVNCKVIWIDLKHQGLTKKNSTKEGIK